MCYDYFVWLDLLSNKFNSLNIDFYNIKLTQVLVVRFVKLFNIQDYNYIMELLHFDCG